MSIITLFTQLPNYTGPGQYPALMHEYDLISAHATLLQVLTHHRVNIPHNMVYDFRKNTVYFYKSSFTDTSNWHNLIEAIFTAKHAYGIVLYNCTTATFFTRAISSPSRHGLCIIHK